FAIRRANLWGTPSALCLSSVSQCGGLFSQDQGATAEGSKNCSTWRHLAYTHRRNSGFRRVGHIRVGQGFFLFVQEGSMIV
ncbi:hypothetical protein, partial [Fischerella thermalis]|uniref:hypothetical protein n=1 Tax=Fischerella thermalis TaxID=372787 RepID=UPI001CA4BA66